MRPIFKAIAQDDPLPKKLRKKAAPKEPPADQAALDQAQALGQADGANQEVQQPADQAGKRRERRQAGDNHEDEEEEAAEGSLASQAEEEGGEEEEAEEEAETPTSLLKRAFEMAEGEDLTIEGDLLERIAGLTYFNKVVKTLPKGGKQAAPDSIKSLAMEKVTKLVFKIAKRADTN